jgi:hypothetical protein
MSEIDLGLGTEMNKVVNVMLNNQPDIAEVDVESIKIGDTLVYRPRDGYGGHNAYITVTKVNRRSFKGVERQGSYHAGREWSIHKEGNFALEVTRPDGRKAHKWANREIWG